MKTYKKIFYASFYYDKTLPPASSDQIDFHLVGLSTRICSNSSTACLTLGLFPCEFFIEQSLCGVSEVIQLGVNN